MTHTSAAMLCLCSVLVISANARAGDALPKRKPGLWELTTAFDGPQSAPRPLVKVQQCVDEKSDQEMQRRALAGPDQRAKCDEPRFKKTGGTSTFDITCKGDDGVARMTGTLSGDHESRYTMVTTTTFEPPRHGMSTMKMTLTGVHAGACPSDMKPGETRVAGIPANPMQPGGPVFDLEKLKNMTPEQRQKWAEEMQKSMGR